MTNRMVRNTKRKRTYRRAAGIQGAGKQYVDKRIREVFPLDKYRLYHGTMNFNVEISKLVPTLYDVDSTSGNVPGGRIDVVMPFYPPTYSGAASYDINYWEIWCGSATRYNQLENGNVFKLRRLKCLFDVYLPNEVDFELEFHLALVPQLSCVGTSPQFNNINALETYIRNHIGGNFFAQHDVKEERTNQAGMVHIYSKKLLKSRPSADLMRTGFITSSFMNSRSVCCDIDLKSLSFMMRTNVSSSSHPGAADNSKYMFYGDDTTTPVILVPYYVVKTNIVAKNNSLIPQNIKDEMIGYVRWMTYVYSRQEKASLNNVV